MQNVYFFSGLGADERVFQYLDLSFCHPVFIKWILPVQNERIESYAKRLSTQVTDKHPVLVGVSFGGMMAVEVAKIVTAEKVIIISSAKTRHEIPFYYKVWRSFPLQKYLPVSFMQKNKRLAYFLFGVKTSEEKALLNAIIKDTDPHFLRWAMDKIIHWKNEAIPKNLTHIHGTTDKLLPYHYVKADISIENGSHWMIVQLSPKISKILQRLL